MALDLGLVLIAVGIVINLLSAGSVPTHAGGEQAQRLPAKTPRRKLAASKQAQRNSGKTPGRTPTEDTSRSTARRRGTLLRSSMMFGVAITAWQNFLANTDRASDTRITIDMLAAVAAIILIFVSIRLKTASIELFSYISLAFVLIIGVFSYAYWSKASTANFNMTLTHLDAIYFAMGTLSTAGTGNITAISATARELQTLQMVFSLGLVIFAVGMAMNRLSATSPPEHRNDIQERRHKRQARKK